MPRSHNWMIMCGRQLILTHALVNRIAHGCIGNYPAHAQVIGCICHRLLAQKSPDLDI